MESNHLLIFPSFVALIGIRVLNVVAHEVREKLKLSTTMDPRPYNVVWVNDPTIPVTGWCLVTFKIGNSKDVV